MKSRKSIFLIIFGWFSLLVAVLIVSTHGLTCREFSELEERVAATDVLRSINALSLLPLSLV
jgi:hypothetical protein